MLRHTASTLARRSNVLLQNTARRYKSSNPLEADSGSLATHAHHTMTVAAAGLVPLWWLLPEEWSVSRGLGVIVAGVLSAHSWIG